LAAVSLALGEPLAILNETGIPASILGNVTVLGNATSGNETVLIVVSESTSTLQPNVVTEIEDEVDEARRIVDRTILAVIVLAILGAIVAMVYWKKRITLPDGHLRKTFRPHKVKQCIYDFCCCGLCCVKLHSALGFDRLKPSPKSWLRVTLIQAGGIKKPISFYCEVWTEPHDGWPKNTRIQTNAAGTCNLGGESVDIEWFGDEEEVVLQVVVYKGSKAHQDVPVGEVRINRDAILKYSREAADAGPDGQAGARAFPVTALDKVTANQRLQRYKDANPVMPLVGLLASQMTAQDGATLDEMTELRVENRRLMTENTSLRIQGSQYTSVPNPPEIIMNMVLRIEILPVRKPPTFSSFQSSSFHLDSAEESP